jgi:oxalate decarboxylase/phosphoglucose isomerase-like protein (cupin superfamily)
MRLAEETMELQAGSFVCLPPGTVHTFANRSEQPVRFLNFNTPAGWEEYMRDLARSRGRCLIARRGQSCPGLPPVIKR